VDHTPIIIRELTEQERCAIDAAMAREKTPQGRQATIDRLAAQETRLRMLLEKTR